MHPETQASITKTGIRLLLEEPFYGHLFSGLLRKVDPSAESISLTISEGQASLLVNPDYWTGLADNHEQYGLLKHQLLHLALKHPFRRADFPHRHIFDIAADLVVNQYIQPQHLPEDAITLERYPPLAKAERGKDVGYYYQKLLEISEQKEQPSPLPDPDNDQLRQHRAWNAFGQQPRMERLLTESALEDALVRAAERSDDKLQGFLPGSLYRLIRERMASAKKQVDWRRVLRLFLGTGRRTYVKNTIRRPSKRYGTAPGTSIRQRQKILVALDTSGSVSPKEIAAFFGEMKHLQRQGAEILVAECDAAIQRTYPLGSLPPLEVKGGGGTDFTPVIRYANEQYRPDAVVYFTDGFAPPPEVRCYRPLLWLISPEGIPSRGEAWQALPGRKVRMGRQH
jgi:predicted metal-dependent peptidase